MLQQPYLISPQGWKWWDWPASGVEERGLMADSRGIDLFFPSANRVIGWVWRDGGNSTITRDPRDLDKPNTWCSRGGGSASYFLLGDAQTGDPLGGVAFPHRPQDACTGKGGLFFVTGQVETQAPQVLVHEGNGGCGFTICSPRDLHPLAKGTFGYGEARCIATRENILVVGGSLGHKPSTDKKGQAVPGKDPGHLKVKNPVQEKPGDGLDGFLAILQLWKP
jgi:hypothetical protein